MDMIYANDKREDIGVLMDYTMDLAFGDDENDFELTLTRGAHCCESGYFIYSEGTEYGGVVDAIATDSDKDEVTYSGRTWHGILANKILCPDSGADYLIVSGEANEILSKLIKRVGLEDIFKAADVNSGIQVSYQFNRYTDAYTGIRKMLMSSGGKLTFTYTADRVVLSAVPYVDYTKDEQFDSELVQTQIEKAYNTVNHLICLGQGELKDRQVIHLYTDTEGNISKKQTITGINEITEVYDYSSAESEEELENGGIEKLEEAWDADSVKLEFDAEEKIYDIGDKIGTKDTIIGIVVEDFITKKIVSIEDNEVTIEYKVG